ncbi:MAG: hypothetical protein KatS3mg102_2341 [Planctomycetota bacterium]|nr:MAG: hypothetical protein KatS3mg102_2341 [Planctomycetota bacterium]
MRGTSVRWVLAAALGAAVAGAAAVPALRSRALAAAAPVLRMLQDLLAPERGAAEAGVWFTCPMHPEIRLPQPGECPICGMTLVEVKGEARPRGSTVQLTPRKVQLGGVRTAEVARRPLVAVIDTVGRIAYDERKLASVAAWVSGRIEALHVDFTGVTIGAGHPLVDLFSPELIAAQQEYLQAIAGLEAVRDTTIPETVASARRLVESTRQRLLWWGLSEQQVEQIRTSGQVRPYVTIPAPIGGTVIKKHVVRGDYVRVGQPLFEIADLSQVWMYADIYESELPLLLAPRAGDYWACPMHPEQRGEKGQSCPRADCGMPLLRQSPGIELVITTQAYPGETFTGRVEFTDPFVNPQTRTVRIRCTIDNPELHLRPDMYVRARIVLGQGELVSVPADAVIFSGQRRIAILDEGGGRFRPVLVRLGRQWLWEQGRVPTENQALPFSRGLGRYHEVLAGLVAGERVVTSGQFLINSEAQLQGALERMLAAEQEREAAAAQAPQAAAGPAAAFDQAMTEAVRAYLELQAALARDALAHAGHLAAPIGRAAARAEEHAADAQQRELARAARQAAAQLEQAGEPAAIRKAFAELSRPLLAWWRARGRAAPELQDVHPAYCPMVDERWLQAGRTIRNPYDPSMPRCGQLED